MSQQIIEMVTNIIQHHPAQINEILNMIEFGLLKWDTKINVPNIPPLNLFQYLLSFPGQYDLTIFKHILHELLLRGAYKIINTPFILDLGQDSNIHTLPIIEAYINFPLDIVKLIYNAGANPYKQPSSNTLSLIDWLIEELYEYDTLHELQEPLTALVTLNATDSIDYSRVQVPLEEIPLREFSSKLLREY